MSFVKNLRSAIQRSFLSLPLILVGWTLFFGSTTGNIGLLVLALGQMAAVPITSVISNTLFEFMNSVLSPYIGDFKNALSVSNVDICNIIPGEVDHAVPNIWVAPSYWLAQITFFFSFLISSGAYVLNMKADEGADPEKVERRKTQATLSLILASFVFLALVVLRKVYTGCETYLGMFLTFTIVGPLGYGWYELARQCSARDVDIFGIVQKVLPAAAQQPPPTTCVYTGSKTNQ